MIFRNLIFPPCFIRAKIRWTKCCCSEARKKKQLGYWPMASCQFWLTVAMQFWAQLLRLIFFSSFTVQWCCSRHEGEKPMSNIRVVIYWIWISIDDVLFDSLLSTVLTFACLLMPWHCHGKRVQRRVWRAEGCAQRQGPNKRSLLKVSPPPTTLSTIFGSRSRPRLHELGGVQQRIHLYSSISMQWHCIGRWGKKMGLLGDPKSNPTLVVWSGYVGKWYETPQFMWRFHGWFNVSKENETTFGWFALNQMEFLILIDFYIGVWLIPYGCMMIFWNIYSPSRLGWI